jgi:thiol-disulfide isomerase/thioredoxin
MRIAFVALGLILAACAPAAAPTLTTVPPTSTTEAAAVSPTEPPTTAPTDVPPTIAPTDVPAAAAHPAWQTLSLTNARTGAAFTLADFAGKTVYVEPMATWCTNCRAQQQRVIPVYEELGTVADSDYVFVSLSVGESVSNEALAGYADREGFNWIFASATPEMISELRNAFGGAVLTPPSTPHFVIRPDGSDSGLKTGPESTEALRSTLLGA